MGCYCFQQRISPSDGNPKGTRADGRDPEGNPRRNSGKRASTTRDSHHSGSRRSRDSYLTGSSRTPEVHGTGSSRTAYEELAGALVEKRTLQKLGQRFKAFTAEKDLNVNQLFFSDLKLERDNPFLGRLFAMFKEAARPTMRNFVLVMGDIGEAHQAARWGLDTGYLAFVYRLFGADPGAATIPREELVRVLVEVAAIDGEGTGLGRDRREPLVGSLILNTSLTALASTLKEEKVALIRGLDSLVADLRAAHSPDLSVQEFKVLRKKYSELFRPTLDIWHNLEEWALEPCLEAVAQMKARGTHQRLEALVHAAQAAQGPTPGVNQFYKRSEESMPMDQGEVAKSIGEVQKGSRNTRAQRKRQGRGVTGVLAELPAFFLGG